MEDEHLDDPTIQDHGVFLTNQSANDSMDINVDAGTHLNNTQTVKVSQLFYNIYFMKTKQLHLFHKPITNNILICIF